MYYSLSCTIQSDGKIVTAVNNKTGEHTVECCSSDEDFNLAKTAASAIERLIENQEKDNDEIKVGDRVSFNANFELQYIYPFDDDFVNNLSIPITSKIRYCYSMHYPSIDTEYYVIAIKDNKAFIQTVSGDLKCYVVSTKILKKVIEKQKENIDEIEVGNRVSFNDYFDTRYVYPYDDGFVYSLSIENTAKIRYCYSISHPPINTDYIVLAKSGNKAYIQTLTARFRCYVVDTKILKKVSK